MLQLVAVSSESGESWTRQVEGSRVVRLGRQPRYGWAVPWDMRISTEHAELHFGPDSVRVVRLERARNSIHFDGQRVHECIMQPGDEFRIGTTTFRLELVDSGAQQKQPTSDDSTSETADAARDEHVEELKAKVQQTLGTKSMNLRAVLDYLDRDSSESSDTKDTVDTPYQEPTEEDVEAAKLEPSTPEATTAPAGSSPQPAVAPPIQPETLTPSVDVIEPTPMQPVPAEPITQTVVGKSPAAESLPAESLPAPMASHTVESKSPVSPAAVPPPPIQQTVEGKTPVAPQAQPITQTVDSKSPAEDAPIAAIKAQMDEIRQSISAESLAAAGGLDFTEELEALPTKLDALQEQVREQSESTESPPEEQQQLNNFSKELEMLREQIRQEAEARQKAEAELEQVATERARLEEEAKARAQAEQLAQERETEIHSLVDQMKALQQEVADQMAAREQEAEQQTAEERARREEEEQARLEAEERARQRETEVADLQSKIAAFQEQIDHHARGESEARAATESTSRQLNEVEEARQSAERSLEQLKVELERRQTESEQARREAESLRSDLGGLQAELEQQDEAHRIAQSTIQRLIEEQAQLRFAEQQRRVEAEQRLLEAEATVARYSGDANELRDQLTALQQRVDEDAAAQQIAEEQARREADSDTRRQLEAEAELRKTEADAARAELESLRQQHQSRVNAVDEAQQRADQLAAENERRREEEAERQAEAARAIERAEQEAQRWQQAATELKEKVESLEQKPESGTSTTGFGLARPRKRPSTEGFDPYHRWLGIPPEEQPPDHYRLLGLSRFEDDRVVIEDAADRQMDHIRRRQLGQHGDLSQKLLNEISAARVCLLDEAKKREYDESLWGEVEAAGPPQESEPEELGNISASISGAAFNDYILHDHLAETRNGHVFQVEHRALGRMGAMMVLSEKANNNPNFVLRFQAKAQLLANADHPNLVKVFDGGHQDGMRYIVMDYVDGGHLIDLMKLRGTLPLNEAIECVVQAAHALGYLHERGVIHRNVKPSNLLLDANSSIRLVGLTQALYDRDTSLINGKRLQSLDETGPCGTLDYMSPEQAVHSGKIDLRADIYSLGCTLFTLLTRRLVFSGKTQQEKIASHREKTPPSIRRLRDDIPETVNQIFQKMVSKHPDERFSSMGEVIAALEESRFLAEAARRATEG